MLDEEMYKIFTTLKHCYVSQTPSYLHRSFDDHPIGRQWSGVYSLLSDAKTNLVYKVGDKVHIITSKRESGHNVRATVTKVDNDGYGYHLQAFRKDSALIHVYNVWDHQLVPRVGKTRRLF